MLRTLIPLTLAAVALMPDWASAFGHRRCYRPPRPVYAVAACPPPVVVVPTYLAVECGPPTPVTAAPAPPLTPPTVNVEPAQPTPAKPDPTPTTPVPPKSKVQLEPDSRELAQPRAEAPPALVPPPPVSPTIQPVSVPTAAAPKPAKLDGLKLTPRTPAGDPLPPLSITPAATVVKASPLAGRPAVDVYPVDGPPAADGTCVVAFYNLADRDVRLTVAGRSVVLPARHKVEAALPPAFAWHLDDGPDRPTTVPAGAAGVEVVVRR